MIPANDANFAKSSPDIYTAVHDAISRALNANGVIASLADSASPRISELCFANPVRADVVSAGRKIAGAAHRRAKYGLLHQGSIQVRLEPKFRSDLAQFLSKRVRHGTISPEVLSRAQTIAQAKYGTPEWLTRR
jgi:lipoate-protein ligase A